MKRVWHNHSQSAWATKSTPGLAFLGEIESEVWGVLGLSLVRRRLAWRERSLCDEKEKFTWAISSWSSEREHSIKGASPSITCCQERSWQIEQLLHSCRDWRMLILWCRRWSIRLMQNCIPTTHMMILTERHTQTAQDREYRVTEDVCLSKSNDAHDLHIHHHQSRLEEQQHSSVTLQTQQCRPTTIEHLIKHIANEI